MQKGNEELEGVEIDIRNSLNNLGNATSPSEIDAQITNIENLIATARSMHPRKNNPILSKLAAILQEALNKATEKKIEITIRNHSTEGMLVVAKEGEPENDSLILKIMTDYAVGITQKLGTGIQNLSGLYAGTMDQGIELNKSMIDNAKQDYEANKEGYKSVVEGMNLITDFLKSPAQKQLQPVERRKLEDIKDGLQASIAVIHKFTMLEEFKEVSKDVSAEDNDQEKNMSSLILARIKARKKERQEGASK